MIRTAIVIFFLCITCAVQGQGRWVKVSDQLIFTDPPFKNCHASTIVETKAGSLLIACFGGSQEGHSDVEIWAGKVNADGTVTPRKVADGIINDSLRYPCWNPVLFKLKNGRLVLFYKVGPNPREWWGEYKLSDDNGLTWGNAAKLPVGILGPIKNKPVFAADGTILCPSSIEQKNGKWKVFIELTDEKLQHWHSVPVDTGGNFDIIQPSILHYSNGTLQLMCRSKQGNVISSTSADNGATWSKLAKTDLLNPNSGTDAVTLKNGEQLIVYNPAWPGKDWYNGRAELRVAESTDGEHWRDIMVLEHGTTEEYSYPAIIQTSDGLVHITYTYNRINIKHVIIKEE